MSFSEVIPYAAWGMSAVFFLATSFGVFKSSILKGAIAAYESNTVALTSRITTLEASDKEKDKLLAKQDIEIQQLKRENELLLAQRPSAEIIAKIDQKLDEYIFHRQQEEDKK